jgi:hypothetical protein
MARNSSARTLEALSPSAGFVTNAWAEAGGAWSILGNDEYRLSVVGRQAERALLLCEAGIGRNELRYRERRLVRNSLPPTLTDSVIVFTDPARSRYLWTFTRQGPAGTLRYLEFPVPGREPALRQALAPGRETGRLAVMPSPPETYPDEEALLGILVGALRPRAPVRQSPQVVLGAIQEADDPVMLRRLARTLRGLRLLDERCGKGTWLLAMATLLEVVWLGLIDRARSWVDDETASRQRRRPEYLADLRALVDAIDEGRRSAEEYVRVRIVQQNLFGLDEQGDAVSACRRTLLRWIDASDPPLPLLDANVRRLHIGSQRTRNDGCFGAAGRSMVHGRGGAVPADLIEEMELLGRAWARVAAARLDRSAPLEELTAAARSLERRRRTLHRKLDLESSRPGWSRPGREGEVARIGLFFPGAVPGITLIHGRQR